MGLLLSCCTGSKPFPAQFIYEYDNKNKVCGQYHITDPVNLQVEYVKDLPCPAIFGFSSSDIPKIEDWARYEQEYIKEKCGGN